MFDVIVVGAGPGGTTAAITMAENGLSVLMIDKRTFPRDKVCGDAISGRSIDVLRGLGLSQFLEIQTSQKTEGITFSSPSGEQIDIPLSLDGEDSPTNGFVCQRIHFDDALLQRAREAGVCVLEGASVTSLLRTGGIVSGVHARLSSQSTIPDTLGVLGVEMDFAAPVVIGADGAHSIVARELGMPSIVEKHHSTGLRTYYSGVTGFNEGNYIELHFVDQSLPGYFWIFPMGNGLTNVGVGMPTQSLKKSRLQLKPLLAGLITHPRFKHRFSAAQQQGPFVGSSLPLGSKPRKMAGNGWLLVGDAASLIDPFTGEGIGNAMLSGQLAAKHILQAHLANDYSEALLSNYEQSVLTVLQSELKLSSTLQNLVKWKWLLNTVIKKSSRSKELKQALTHMFASVDQREQLASPLFYLKLLFA